MKLAQFLRATLVVALIGAIGGALGGALIGLTVIAVNLFGGHGDLARRLGDVLGITAFTGAFGAAFGVVLGPLLGWALMRRVPLGRAIGETAFAAALGVGAAFVVPAVPLAIFVYPVFGALAAALRLRHSYRLAPERTAAASDQITSG